MRHAKIRSVGPQFFSDEEVVELSMAARLLLISLGTMADDQGVFRWKPVQIKGYTFPMDQLDIVALMLELVEQDLVRHFEADGSVFGAIRGWGRHQKPRDARAAHPLPHSLDGYVRLLDIPAPREKKGRASAPWPLRPRDVPGTVKVAVDSSGAARPSDVPGTSQGRPLDGPGTYPAGPGDAPGTPEGPEPEARRSAPDSARSDTSSPVRPWDVPGTAPVRPGGVPGASHVEGRGVEGSGVEFPPSPPPGGSAAPRRGGGSDPLDSTLGGVDFLGLPAEVVQAAQAWRADRLARGLAKWSRRQWRPQLLKAREDPAAWVLVVEHALTEGFQSLAGAPGGAKASDGLTTRARQQEANERAGERFAADTPVGERVDWLAAVGDPPAPDGVQAPRAVKAEEVTSCE